MRYPFEAAWVLHEKFLKENKNIFYLLTASGSRTVVMRASGGTKKTRKNPLQFFTLLQVSAALHKPMSTVYRVETLAPACWLQGPALYAGLYVNEITFKLTQKYEPEADLMQSYQKVLQGLSALGISALDDPNLAILLRTYEADLLTSVGYGFDWGALARLSGSSIAYDPYERGFYADDLGFDRDLLRQLASEHYADAKVRRLAKVLYQSKIKALIAPDTLTSLTAFSPLAAVMPAMP